MFFPQFKHNFIIRTCLCIIAENYSKLVMHSGRKQFCQFKVFVHLVEIFNEIFAIYGSSLVENKCTKFCDLIINKLEMVPCVEWNFISNDLFLWDKVFFKEIEILFKWLKFKIFLKQKMI